MFTNEEIEKARRVSLLDYLSVYESHNMERVSRDTIRLRDHDSLNLTVSSGLWHWFSKGIGGRNALDYLIQVRGFQFPEAMARLRAISGSDVKFGSPQKAEKQLQLPTFCENQDCVIRYLTGRGIDREILMACIRDGTLKEDLPYHNCVFIGYDRGKPKFACLRGTWSDYKADCKGSDKRYSFCLSPGAPELFVFESAIDALSYATIQKRADRDWRKTALLSLDGIQADAKNDDLPIALSAYLGRWKEPQRIVLCLDNDEPGNRASTRIANLLKPVHDVREIVPPCGKDVNEYLISTLRKEERSWVR